MPAKGARGPSRHWPRADREAAAGRAWRRFWQCPNCRRKSFARRVQDLETRVWRTYCRWCDALY